MKATTRSSASNQRTATLERKSLNRPTELAAHERQEQHGHESVTAHRGGRRGSDARGARRRRLHRLLALRRPYQPGAALLRDLLAPRSSESAVQPNNARAGDKQHCGFDPGQPVLPMSRPCFRDGLAKNPQSPSGEAERKESRNACINSSAFRDCVRSRGGASRCHLRRTGCGFKPRLLVQLRHQCQPRNDARPSGAGQDAESADLFAGTISCPNLDETGANSSAVTRTHSPFGELDKRRSQPGLRAGRLRV